MRTTIALLTTTLVTMLAHQGAAAEPAASGSKSECNTREARAFKKSVENVVKKYASKAAEPDELWSHDPVFRGWVSSPTSTLPEVERFLRCTASPALEEVRLMSVALVCLDLDSQLAYIQRLASLPQSKPNGWALHYAVSPGYAWSTRLAFNDKNDSVKTTLKQVWNSPNVTPGLQRIVYEILEGMMRKALVETPVKPLLACPQLASK